MVQHVADRHPGLVHAFQKAGQDGYQASNVFGQMIQNIAYATQSGSPELAKYANLVGMTVQQFKGLGGSDQILRVFESINQQGPRAITTLNRMGLDGMRTVAHHLRDGSAARWHRG